MPTGKYIHSKYATNFFNGQVLSDIGDGVLATDVATVQQTRGAVGFGPYITVSNIAGRGDFYTGDYASDDLCVQAAYNKGVSEYGVGLVLIKPATLNFAAPVVLGSKAGIFSWNKRGTVIKTNNNNISLFTITGTAGTANYLFDIFFQNLELRGNNNAAHTINFGVKMQYATYVRFYDVFFRQLYNAINADDVTDCLMDQNCVIRECVDHGVELKSTGGTTSDNKFINSIFERNTKFGLHMNGSDMTTVIDSTFRDNSFGTVGWEGIGLDATTYNVTRPIIVGNKFYDTRAGGSRTQDKGIEVLETTGTVSGCIVANNIAYNNVTSSYAANLGSKCIIFTPDTKGSKVGISTANTSNPPTNAELDTEFGTPAQVGAGFSCLINDNAGGSNSYYVWSDGTNWWYTTGTKAV
jgi:hypothetical protein